MIMPVFTYCGVLQMNLSETKMNQLKAFHDRCLKVVYDGEKSNEGLPSVVNANKIRAYKLVRKCIDKDICGTFEIILQCKIMERRQEMPITACRCQKSGLNMLANPFIIQEQRSTMNCLQKLER